MISHRHACLRPRPGTIAYLLVVFIAFSCLLPLPPQLAQDSSPAHNQAPSCNRNPLFAGDWRLINDPNGKMSIFVQGDFAEGVYIVGNTRRKFSGKITREERLDLRGNAVCYHLKLTGDWVPEEKGEGGTFSALLNLDFHYIQISFYDNNQKVISAETWGSQAGQPQPSPSPNPQGGTVNPLAAILQGLSQQNSGVSSDHDTDQFKTFDGLTKLEQEQLLIKRGPRLPRQYNSSDLNLRVFVRGGAPLVIDYQLDSDEPAYLTINVGDVKPLVIPLEPAKFTQRVIMLPDHFGKESQVGKLHFSALTSKRQPANFRLYGLAMGFSGAHALNKLIEVPRHTELALTTHSFGPSTEHEPLALFAHSLPQTNQEIQITVSPPTSIVTGQRPKQEIAFSFKARSLFDNGYWEILALNGMNETHVWNKKTGRITPNRTFAEKWDGKLTHMAKVMPGDFSVKVRAWRGDVSKAFVIARAPATLVVIK